MAVKLIAAIHQPTFFPWLSYFDKIVRSDKFVVLDSVQYTKTGGSWSNRVKIMISGKADWITVPIIRSYSGTRNINEIQIDNTLGWKKKILKTIEVNYSKAPNYYEIFGFITELFEETEDGISGFNIKIIKKVCKVLDIDTSHFILGSSLNTTGNATDLLISIIKNIGADAYICGGGSAKYQEDDKFADNGIELIYQDFSHPAYEQFNTKEFTPGLSIIDVLMNCGIESTSEMIRKASKNRS